jgi:hypothetical protein
VSPYQIFLREILALGPITRGGIIPGMIFWKNFRTVHLDQGGTGVPSPTFPPGAGRGGRVPWGAVGGLKAEGAAVPCGWPGGGGGVGVRRRRAVTGGAMGMRLPDPRSGGGSGRLP